MVWIMAEAPAATHAHTDARRRLAALAVPDYADPVTDGTPREASPRPVPPDDALRREAVRLAAGALALGLGVFAAPVRAARLFGFPTEHANSTTLTMARLYAIREAARGVQLIGEARSRSGPRHSTAVLNLGIDATDAAMFAVLAARRPELRRASTTLVLFAGGVSALWLRYARRVGTRAA